VSRRRLHGECCDPEAEGSRYGDGKQGNPHSISFRGSHSSAMVPPWENQSEADKYISRLVPGFRSSWYSAGMKSVDNNIIELP
jgi:hypothetical protein